MVQGEIIFLDKLPTEAIHRKAKNRKARLAGVIATEKLSSCGPQEPHFCFQCSCHDHSGLRFFIYP